MKNAKMKRSLQVDTMRGIACILLVFFHTVGSPPDEGLRIPQDHWLQEFNQFLVYFRMPLFAFISGYVYAFRPFQGNPGAFIKGKARRLLLPLLTVGTFYAIVQALTPGTNTNVERWWLLHIMPVGHFWFLESLFIIFLVIILLEQRKALSTVAGFCALWLASALLFGLADFPNYLGSRGAIYLMPFFLAGLACKRFEIVQPPALVLAALALAGGIAIVVLFPEDMRERNLVAALASVTIGVSAALLLLRSGWQSRLLAYIGAYSFAIYLLHVFFTAGSRIVLQTLGVDDIYALLVPGTVAGLWGPILCAQLISRSETLNLWLLGNTTRMEPSTSRAREATV
jgi:fucose 4-O-acetylase-like acetyltransferase